MAVKYSIDALQSSIHSVGNQQMANNLALRRLTDEFSTLKNTETDFLLHKRVIELTNTFYKFLATRDVRGFELPNKVFTLPDHDAEVAFANPQSSSPGNQTSIPGKITESTSTRAQKQLGDQSKGYNSVNAWENPKCSLTTVSQDVSETNNILCILGAKEIDSDEIDSVTPHRSTFISKQDTSKSAVDPAKQPRDPGQNSISDKVSPTGMHDKQPPSVDGETPVSNNHRLILRPATAHGTNEENEKGFNHSSEHSQQRPGVSPSRSQKGQESGSQTEFINPPWATSYSALAMAGKLLQYSRLFNVTTRTLVRQPHEMDLVAKRLEILAELLWNLGEPSYVLGEANRVLMREPEAIDQTLSYLMRDFRRLTFSADPTFIRRLFLSAYWYLRRKQLMRLSDTLEQQKADLSMLLQFHQAQYQARGHRQILELQNTLQQQQRELLGILQRQRTGYE